MLAGRRRTKASAYRDRGNIMQGSRTLTQGYVEIVGMLTDLAKLMVYLLGRILLSASDSKFSAVTWHWAPLRWVTHISSSAEAVP